MRLSPEPGDGMCKSENDATVSKENSHSEDNWITRRWSVVSAVYYFPNEYICRHSLWKATSCRYLEGHCFIVDVTCTVKMENQPPFQSGTGTNLGRVCVSLDITGGVRASQRHHCFLSLVPECIPIECELSKVVWKGNLDCKFQFGLKSGVTWCWHGSYIFSWISFFHLIPFPFCCSPLYICNFC